MVHFTSIISFNSTLWIDFYVNLNDLNAFTYQTEPIGWMYESM